MATNSPSLQNDVHRSHTKHLSQFEPMLLLHAALAGYFARRGDLYVGSISLEDRRYV